MAATVQIHEMSAAGVGVDKTAGTVRFKSTDDNVVDTNGRISIPATGSTYSYTKQLRLNVTVAPSVDLQNLRAYSDGVNSFGTGVSVGYDIPAGGLGSFPQVITDIAGTDLFTATSGSPIDLDLINTGPHTGTGYIGDILRLQMAIASTASPGQLAAETLTFAYDET